MLASVWQLNHQHQAQLSLSKPNQSTKNWTNHLTNVTNYSTRGSLLFAILFTTYIQTFRRIWRETAGNIFSEMSAALFRIERTRFCLVERSKIKSGDPCLLCKFDCFCGCALVSETQFRYMRNVILLRSGYDQFTLHNPSKSTADNIYVSAMCVWSEAKNSSATERKRGQTWVVLCQNDRETWIKLGTTSLPAWKPEGLTLNGMVTDVCESLWTAKMTFIPYLETFLVIYISLIQRDTDT